jgi:VWFA-related protein
MMILRRLHLIFSLLGLALMSQSAFGQPPQNINGGTPTRGTGKPVTIPLTIKMPRDQEVLEIQNIDLSVTEDGEPQTIISIRGFGSTTPMTVAVLIQDDVVPSIANEIKGLAEFIRALPKGSRVMIGYLRTGSLQVRQKFTTDLEKAAKSLRAPSGTATAGPYNPYVEVIEALRKFESQPLGRRAILMVSDGLDISRGFDSSAPSQSVDLQRAVNESQRRGVAIYGFYAPTAATASNSVLAVNGQGSLLRLSNESGGAAFFQGTGVPVSFDPFLRELDVALQKQAALTFLSTHLNKGFHRIDVKSATPGVRVAFPSGYMR